METIRKLMSRDIETIQTEDSVREAATKMKKFNIGALPVCEGEKLRGILTDRDIVIRSVAGSDEIEDLKVKDVMSSKITCAHDDQNLEDAAKLMKKERIRRLPIVNNNDRLVGMLSLDDVVEEDHGLAAKALRGISKDQSSTLKFKPFGRPQLMTAFGALAAAGIYLWMKRQNHRAFGHR